MPVATPPLPDVDAVVDTFDVDAALGALEALQPGLAGSVVDLLDALHDRTDDLGPARPDLLARIAAELEGRWHSTTTSERPLLVLDVLRRLLVRQVETVIPTPAM